MKKTIIKRLEALRNAMTEEGMDYFFLSDGDCHNSEYVGEYYKLRTAYSGFTGSNGILLVGREEARLWTDGRYFVQAAKELEGTGILLMRQGEKGVPTLFDYLGECDVKNPRIGVDGSYISHERISLLKDVMEDNYREYSLIIKKDFAREVLLKTEDLPAFRTLEAKPVRVLQECFYGKTVKEKAEDVCEELGNKNAHMFLSSSLDANMWLMNIRGCDIPHNPVAFSYVLITPWEKVLFIHKQAITPELEAYCRKEEIILEDYGNLEEVIGEKCNGKKILTSFGDLSAYLVEVLKDKNIKWVDGDAGVSLRKAVKDEAELKAMKEIYLKDSAAVCKFLCWLSKQPAGSVTETEAADKMDALRSEIPEFTDLSFSTIAAYGANAAMMHYEPDRDHPVVLQDGNVFLLDSGGQYKGGTTDVTRTVAIGEVSEEIKEHFTRVTRGMLALQNCKFMYGCTGMNLDILARGPLWEIGSDYKCGTGHGIGFMLNVHEGPQAIRMRGVGVAGKTPFEPGMVVSDEPGVYLEGKYGIRMENILLCTECFENGDGRFLSFEPLTFVPVDMRLILKEFLTAEAMGQLFEYQQMVYKNISPFLSEEERKWLKKETDMWPEIS
ncbi:MAG: aminopeptidase P family protein [Lachnospiraceae bacterium]|nr:aminopeptidase P family protein [Lachnospiraceae bacterium]